MSIGMVDVWVDGARLRAGRDEPIARGVANRRAWAQPPQNLSSTLFTVPQPGQPPGNPLPQLPQCLRHGSFGCRQAPHTMSFAMPVEIDPDPGSLRGHFGL